MVTQATSFSRSGVSDWLIQRVTSLILLAYFLCVGGTLIIGVDYSGWKDMSETVGMRVFTLLAVLSLAAHAWIGLWSVFTDYITERMMGPRANFLRLVCQVGTILVLMVLVLWVVEILWISP